MTRKASKLDSLMLKKAQELQSLTPEQADVLITQINASDWPQNTKNLATKSILSTLAFFRALDCVKVK